MGNLPSNIKIIYWVHSGGADPLTGKPSFASILRLKALVNTKFDDSFTEAVLAGKALFVFSGEPTRKSGGIQQADALQAWWMINQTALKTITRVYNTDMMRAYMSLRQEFSDVETIVFVNDDVHMSRYLWQFAKTDRVFAAKIFPLMVPVTTNPDYVEKYPLNYMAAYNALAWLKEALKLIGICQFILFGLDRGLNKPTKNPVKRSMIKIIDWLIQKDLR